MSKLLQISIEVNSGSVGRIAEQIGQKAIDSGWESYITYARNNLQSRSQLIKIGSLYDVYAHGVLTRITDRHAFYSTRATEKLIKQIEVINPDIIHLHHLHGYFINIRVLFNFLSSLKIPIVWTFHDCWSFTGHCTHFEYVDCNRWFTGCYDCPQKKEYPASFLIDRSLKNYKDKKELFNSVDNMVIVPVSYWLGDLVKKSFLKKYPVFVIQNGIDIDVFKPSTNIEQIKSKYNLKKKFIILGVASVWTALKGINDFIELNKKLDDNVKIILVGLSKKQIKNLPANMIGIERTENIQQLADLYSIADVFVNLTYEDTFPSTNLEALACGTPVITYKTGGSVESVNTETGLVVEKGDIPGILQAIQIIMGKSEDFYLLNCRKSAEEHYNRNVKFTEYIDLYKKLLS
ncbi:MAG: glycosyltransferase [Bacilli bacterium]|nr:glycosyltransferase [Bacilli bacterium]